MGVKYDAVKDDRIEMTTFSGKDLMEVTEKVNYFLGHKMKNLTGEEEDRGFRYVPLGLAHSTEVKTHTDKFGFCTNTVWYHVVLTYKVVTCKE